MRIAVYGAGAMGTVLGALLARSGADVDLISRNRSHVEAMKEHGARLYWKTEERETKQQVRALLPEEMKGKYDIVFLMTKQRENRQIAAFLKDYLSTEGIVCTAQNGFPEESVAEVLGAEKTYGAVAAWGANFIGEGKVEVTSASEAMSVEIGSYSGGGEKLDSLEKLLRPIGEIVKNPDFVKRTENLVGSRWSKLSINAAFSGLSVLTGLTFGELARRRKSKRIALGILRECFAVAAAAGVKLEKLQGHDMEKLLGGSGFFARLRAAFLLPIAMKKHAKLRSGMLRDVQSGRKCEIDYIDGAVSRCGDKYGVDTPLCDKVTEIVHGIENGLYETTYGNVDFFDGQY